MSIWQLLIQFVFRITFGVALAMGVTPSRLVTSGFYRVHLWVLMGLNTFAALAIYTQFESFSEAILYPRMVLAMAIALAVLSYVGSVMWLYEKVKVGATILYVVALGAFIAAILATTWKGSTTGLGVTMALLDMASSGVLLGVTLSAMFLGHWYLNTPTMDLVPLKRLVLFILGAIIARTIVSSLGLLLQAGSTEPLETVFWIFVTFRWLSGLLGTAILALMTWYTLKVPNTQSATGILYAGVVLTFLGELSSQLLSVGALYPL